MESSSDYDNYKQYKEFIEMLESKDVDAKDVYNEIMSKEQKALDSINTIIDKRENSKRPKDAIMELSISEHYFRLVKCMYDIFSDCMVVTDIKEVPWLFLEGDRKIYVGVVLVIISLFLFFVTISN